MYSYDEGETWYQLPSVPNAVKIYGIVSEYVDDNRITICYVKTETHPIIGYCAYVKPWESNEWHEYEYNGLTICRPQYRTCLTYSKYDGSIALVCVSTGDSGYGSAYTSYSSGKYRAWLKGRGKNSFKPYIEYNDHSINTAFTYSENHWNMGGYNNVWCTNGSINFKNFKALDE